MDMGLDKHFQSGFLALPNGGKTLSIERPARYPQFIVLQLKYCLDIVVKFLVPLTEDEKGIR